MASIAPTFAEPIGATVFMKTVSSALSICCGTSRSALMRSAIYTGQLRHRRFSPCLHEFSYRLFMMYIDLSELNAVFKNRWLWSAKRPALAWLRRKDYLGDPQIPLDQA